EGARNEAASRLTNALTGLRAKIENVLIGVSVADIANMFTQLSFTSVEPSSRPGGPELLEGFGVRAGAMVLSQVGDMVSKAVQNVSSDTGVPINQKYVVRRMQFLGKDVNTLGALKRT